MSKRKIKRKDKKRRRMKKMKTRERRRKKRRKMKKMQMKKTTLSICISSAEINTKMILRIKTEALLWIANSNYSLR